MRDTLDSYAASLPKWPWLQTLVGAKNWDFEIREINPKAPVHATVRARFDLPEVRQCAGVGAYRPDALKNHESFKQYYQPLTSAESPAHLAPKSCRISRSLRLEGLMFAGRSRMRFSDAKSIGRSFHTLRDADVTPAKT